MNGFIQDASRRTYITQCLTRISYFISNSDYDGLNKMIDMEQYYYGDVARDLIENLLQTQYPAVYKKLMYYKILK